MDIENETEEPFPPLSPEGERVNAENPEFLSECLRSLDKLSPLGRIDVMSHTFTHNKVWGDVLRVDFTSEKSEIIGRVNRVLFWRAKNGTISEMIAIGQDIPPLTAEAIR